MGCTTTSMDCRERRTTSRLQSTPGPCSSRMPNQPKFFAPYSSLGWAQAWSGVTPCICSRSCRGKGRRRPRAITSRRRYSAGMRRPSLLADTGNIALCSLSMGNSSEPESATACINKPPAITRASLLASNIFLPACTAARVGTRPARRQSPPSPYLQRHHWQPWQSASTPYIASSSSLTARNIGL